MLNIFWHRRDIRLSDNAGLYHALRSDFPVQPIFIFDTEILDKLEDKADARVTFIHDEISKMKDELQLLGSDLWVFHGRPLEVFKKLVKSNKINTVFTNRDYEEYALRRDKEVEGFLDKHHIGFRSYKDHVIFEGDEVLKKDGNPYTVFTPYKKTWLAKLQEKMRKGNSYFLTSYPTKKYGNNFSVSAKSKPMTSLKKMGFSRSHTEVPGKTVSQKLIKSYNEERDFPARDGTSRLGLHFRFGTLSIREKARKAMGLSDTFLSELIWRDFYSQILQHFPHVEKNAFRAKYEAVAWRNDEDEFQAWCEGRTGYPIVDAGMRELNETGHMHNRVRMIVASFLTKHLLIDWRWGEAYFAEKLLDFDLASNNGGWQWAAGCGTDAAPYFRIFNPTTQMERFDKEKKYVKRWVAEWGSEAYPEPIVDHKMARERCLKTYKEALDKHVNLLK